MNKARCRISIFFVQNQFQAFFVDSRKMNGSQNISLFYIAICNIWSFIPLMSKILWICYADFLPDNSLTDFNGLVETGGRYLERNLEKM